MSLTQEIKEELCLHPPKRRCCQKTSLSVFLKLSSSQDRALLFSSAGIARYLVTLLKQLHIEAWGMGISAGVGKRHGQIIFQRPPLMHDSTLPVPAKKCCRQALLQSAFLIKGSIALPRVGYHLEIHGLNQDDAKKMAQILSEKDCEARAYRRRGDWVAVIKSGESIARLLNLLGAHRALLRFEERRALKETKNDVRRRVNYEAANLSRVVIAAGKQRQMVEQIMNTKLWHRLPSGVKEAAMARYHHPTLSLKELAQKLGMTKSALNHRLRRLKAMASIKS